MRPLTAVGAALLTGAAVIAASLALAGGDGSGTGGQDTSAVLRACLVEANPQRAQICMADRAEELTRSRGIAPVLADLEAEFTAGVVGANCHEVLHLFGQRVGRAYGTDAVVDTASFCEGGFYHGLIGELGDLSAGKACDRLGTQARRFCWHGVGHAAFETLGVDKAGTACPVGDQDLQGICLEGVFMELSRALVDPTGTSIEDHCPFGEEFDACTRALVSTKSTTYPDLMLDWCRRYAELGGEISQCNWLVGSGLSYTVTMNERSADRIHTQLTEGCGGDDDCLAGGIVGIYINTLDHELASRVCRMEPALTEADCRLWSQGSRGSTRSG